MYKNSSTNILKETLKAGKNSSYFEGTYNLIISYPWIILGIIIIILSIIIFILIKAWNKHLSLNRSTEMIFLRITMPRMDTQQGREVERSSQEDFKLKVGKMDQLISAFHSIHTSSLKTLFTGQDYISLEIMANHMNVENGVEIQFFVVCQKKYVDMISKQITGFYNDCSIEETPDYQIFSEGYKTASTKLKLSDKKQFLPLRTYQNMDTDSLNGLVNTLSGLEINEGAAIQIVIRPRGSAWTKKAYKKTNTMFQGKKSNGTSPLSVIGDLGNIMLHGPDQGQMPGQSSSESERLTPGQEERIKQIESKLSKPCFDCVLRIVSSAKNKSRAEMILSGIKSAFTQFGLQNLNSFEFKKYFTFNIVKNFIFRFMDWGKYKMILSSEEIATIFHFPNAIFNPSQIIKWLKFKSAPAPSLLPTQGLKLGYNNFRGKKREIRINSEDRFRHLYIIGQTGMGKSVLQKTLIKQDLKMGNGICVVDPHGDLIEDVLEWIPRGRANDVILFDPSDTDRPLGLNLLEAKTNEEKDFIALDAMNMMIGLFGNEIFGPRIQDYFRNGCLTLMDDPDGGAITDIVRLFTDDAFQRYKVSKVKNPIVKSFWTNQMAKTGEKEKSEMIPYFAAKFGSFITNATMRNIVGQVKSAFDFSKAMNSKKIILAKLSKGLIGDINANLLGMIFVNKIQVAAMRRQAMPKEERMPFFLYVDEFQNFVTDAFESILSEARKYRLGLIIAHQYIGQLIKDGKDEKIKNAVFGNVGTMLNFKIGATDAEYMAKEMAPVFQESDLINLEGFNTCIKLNVNNIISRPFSMNTLKDFEDGDKEAAEAYRQLSRLKYGRDVAFVDKEIRMRIGA